MALHDTNQTGVTMVCKWAARLHQIGALLSLIALLVVIGSQPLTAQGTTASLTGQVTDSTGAVVPKATVTARNNVTNEAVTQETSDGGSFLFPQLLPGSYTVTVEHAGFSKLAENNVVLTIGQAGTLNLSL